MDNLKLTIAKNIAMLRRSAGLTQIAFAEELHYSDKAVSKWERGESLPDIEVLKRIADFFDRTVDYLLVEHTQEELVPEPDTLAAEVAAARRRNRVTTVLLANAVAWLAATIVFAVLSLATSLPRLWMIFIYAALASCIISIIFSAMWGGKSTQKLLLLFVSLLLWGILACLYLLFWEQNISLIFFIGLPGQAAILIATQFKRTKKLIEAHLPQQKDK